MWNSNVIYSVLIESYLLQKDFPIQLGIVYSILAATSMQNKPEMIYPSLEACVAR